MPHQVTVTAKTGPDRTNTALVVPAVLGVDFQLSDKRLFIQTETAAGDNIKEYDLNGVTVVTCTITAGNFAFVVS
jgi:hypothetical protein